MSRRRRTGLLAFLVTAALAVGTPAAVAEPSGWTPTGATYSTTSTFVRPVALLLDSAGRQTSVFTADHDVWVVDRAPGAAWSTPVKLSAGDLVDGSVSAAGNQDGDGFIAWQTTENGAPALRISTRSLGGGWTPAFKLATPAIDPRPAVSVSPQGSVHIGWRDRVAGVDRAYGASGTAGGGPFTTPYLFSTLGVARIAVASSGSGVTRYAVAGDSGGSGSLDVHSYSSRGGATWSSTNVRTVSGRQLGELDLRVLGDHTSLVWSEKITDSDYRVVASTRPSGGAWSSPVDLSGPATFYADPQAVPLSDGGAMVVWTVVNGDGTRDLRLAGGGGTTWFALGNGATGQINGSPVLAPSPDGATALLGWTHIEDGTVTARARTIQIAGTVLGPERTLGPNTGGSTFALGGDGDAYAAISETPGYHRLAGYVLDSHAPTGAALTSVTPLPLAGAATAGWTAQDTWSRPLRYDVAVRSAGRNGVFGGAGLWRSGTAAASGAYPVAPGRTYCFAVRATDAVGNAGGWSAERCTSTPTDDRSMTGAGWSAVSGSAYFRGTAKQTRKKGKVLTLTGVRTRTITVLASRGPTYGKVAVRMGGVTVATLDTRGPAQARRAFVVRLPSVRTGTLQLVTTTRKTVRIDGVVTSPS